VLTPRKKGRGPGGTVGLIAEARRGGVATFTLPSEDLTPALAGDLRSSRRERRREPTARKGM
jgi:hypothetical protein